ncbi:hypothetical protein HRbin10_00674 [bacterium HR10]|nr:hypothetical protein HRbin10_00674 [bacterium HR10]
MRILHVGRARWSFVGLSLVMLGLMLPFRASFGQDAIPAGLASSRHPPVDGLTGDIIFARLLERNRQRESHLKGYTVVRTYQVRKENGRVRAEAQVVMRYRAPDVKEYTIIFERGSGFVRRRVFRRLLESEVETAAGRNLHDSSITPANYRFELLGEEDVDGFHCFVVRALPTRKDKYLFDGRIWIEANDFAILKIEGQPAKNPSFWIKRVEFVRRYRKIGEFWLPLKDESVTQVRIVGTNVLTIDYTNYEIVRGGAPNEDRITTSGRP